MLKKADKKARKLREDNEEGKEEREEAMGESDDRQGAMASGSGEREGWMGQDAQMAQATVGDGHGKRDRGDVGCLKNRPRG